MNNLFTYISAITEEYTEPYIIDKKIKKETYQEEKVIFENIELIVRFNNGVTIKKLTEQEHSSEKTNSTCKECWISYEIIEHPKNLKITPKRKNFTNRCQEFFWLQMNTLEK